MSTLEQRRFLTINPDDNLEAVRALSSPLRVQILNLLHRQGAMNVNEISDHLDIAQSTVATNIHVLEAAALIETELVKASKGQQKICRARFDEIVVRLDGMPAATKDDVVEVAMPLGLYTACQVSAPCGLCSTKDVIGLLDVPDLFLDPSRMQASLIWFGRGYVEYKFPNNAKVLGATPIDPVEQSLGRVTSFGSTSPEAIEILRQSLTELYGLEGGLFDQYAAFWGRMLRADFGPSLSAFPTPVSYLIWQALPWTVGLLVSATVIAWILGNLLGGLAGYYRDSRALRVAGVVAMAFHPNLFKALRDDLGVSIVYITHDLTTAYHISDRIIIMQGGKVVEEGAARTVLSSPKHPYTRLLRSSVLSADATEQAPAAAADPSPVPERRSQSS